MRGLSRCSCGGRMGTQTTKPRGSQIIYHHYACNRRGKLHKIGGCVQESLSTLEIEAQVWEIVSSSLRDPARPRGAMNRLIEEERAKRSGYLERETKIWSGKVA